MGFPARGSQPVIFLTPSNNLSSGTEVSVPFTGEELNSIRLPFSKRILGLEHLSFSAGSYRDLTRVAKLNETMWTELFLDNADHLGFELDCLIRSLREYRDAIAAGDAETLCRLLKEGRERKECIDTEWRNK